MLYLRKFTGLSATIIAVGLLSACSSHGARYDGQSSCDAAPKCHQTQSRFQSRYAYEAQSRCSIEWVQCGWGVNWIAIPTYHQIIVPILRPAPQPPVYEPPTYEPPQYIPPTYEPPTYVPPAEPEPPVYEPPVYVTPEPEPEPPVYVPPHYPEPPIYIPPPPIIRK